MLLIPILSVLSLAVSETTLHEGSLCLSAIGSPSPYYLGLAAGTVVSSHAPAPVSYQSTGTLLFENGQYLRVDEHGKFVASSEPDSRFELTNAPGSTWTFDVSYMGHHQFQLCADASIGHKSDCVVERNVTLNYEQDWETHL